MMKKIRFYLPSLLLIALFILSAAVLFSGTDIPSKRNYLSHRKVLSKTVKKVIKNARWQTEVTTIYDPSYQKIPYPNGDVPIERGVCTDVVIRAFRAVKIDLQKEVYLHKKNHRRLYYGLYKNPPDRNIDHRRVPNLMVYLKSKGASRRVSDDPAHYLPGDLVVWNLNSKGLLFHIGIVSDRVTKKEKRPLVIHNIGYGAREEDVLFSYKIIGHYRYFKQLF